jgi:uncharacterized protein YfaS (alpha-2-macroglobulin family)
MAAGEYEMGDTVRLKTSITVDDVLTNPTTITLKVRKPDGTITTETPVQDGVTGKYRFDIVVNQHGTWSYRFEGTGPAAGVGERSFIVKHSRFT